MFGANGLCGGGWEGGIWGMVWEPIIEADPVLRKDIQPWQRCKARKQSLRKLLPQLSFVVCQWEVTAWPLTITHQQGGRSKHYTCVFLCICHFIQARMEGGKKEVEGCEIQIQLGAFARRCLKGESGSNISRTSPKERPTGAYFSLPQKAAISGDLCREKGERRAR